MTNYDILVDYFNKIDLARWLASINCQCNRNPFCPAYEMKEPMEDVICKGADDPNICMELWLEWLEKDESNTNLYDKEKDLSAWLDCANDVLKDFPVIMTARMLSKIIKCYDCPVNKCTGEDLDDEKKYQSKCECCFRKGMKEPVIVFTDKYRSIEVS